MFFSSLSKQFHTQEHAHFEKLFKLTLRCHLLRAGVPLRKVGTVLCHLRLASSSHGKRRRKAGRGSALGNAVTWGGDMLSLRWLPSK